MQYKVSCLNCGVQLYIELPPNCVNFQCCQCYAVHKVLIYTSLSPSLAHALSLALSRVNRDIVQERLVCVCVLVRASVRASNIDVKQCAQYRMSSIAEQ